VVHGRAQPGHSVMYVVFHGCGMEKTTCTHRRRAQLWHQQQGVFYNGSDERKP
jgi:hypothetical protein